MFKSSRVVTAAIVAVAVAACVGNPDSVPSQSQSTLTSVQPETIVPHEYYGRTEFEIPGGDGQVADYSNG